MNILVIEDDARIADFLQRGLRAEGHAVRVARDGPGGLALARDAAREQREGHGPCVVLLDVMLPGQDGIEVCRTLRAEGNPLPILMLTALGAVDERVAGLRSGADDYLPKPFDFDELLARIDALARRARTPGGERPARLVVDDLVFDRDTMKVSRGGVFIELTARELALLELLMSAPGRLFSRERILASVWGANEDPLTNVVDVYVRRLRSKLDVAGGRPLIRTQRGLGYRLEAPLS
ncbi:response regulator transcription factor [Methylibium petroleiphilum]|uniref:response regulator transcription factor n=1 Tax=Methylibium petroleiphilum TaxID=105560 RepID=UPI001AC45470|nr:response regulator transcription factor [Methylibium petroleiphilum]MBN9203691.1 response regulator transcription factor [Methylibium petroleiphilum]